MKTPKAGARQETPRLTFQRADPAELEKFDIRTKECTMNCGPHMQDPRSEKERRFLCEDCYIVRQPA